MNLLLWSNTNIYKNRTKLIQITIADTFQVGTRTIFRLYHMLYSIRHDPVSTDNFTVKPYISYILLPVENHIWDVFCPKGRFRDIQLPYDLQFAFWHQKVYKYNVSKWNKYDISGALFTFDLSIRHTVYPDWILNVKRAPDMSTLFYFEMLYLDRVIDGIANTVI